jgi:ectoine hydroxylase-related dioxygenase (phytanoyl-CoA dioxygenase family)
MAIRSAPAVQPFIESNDALEDTAELRRRLVDDGYLFVRRLVDPDLLADLRRDMLEVCRAGAWLVAGTPLLDGVADVSQKCAEGDPEYHAVYRNIQRLEAFHRAGHAPAVLDLMQRITGDTVLPHPAKVARLWFPQNTQHTTPAHQDHVHFQGAYETYTCWTPVGDCPLELGGLAVLAGSHRTGTVYEHHFSLGAGGLTLGADQLAGTWLSADYAMGDALIFPSLTIHQALPNLTPDRLRVSLDNRYQGLSQPIAEHELQPHLSRGSGQTWKDIYAGWRTTDLQYYWRELPLRIVPTDTRQQERGFREAVARARAGDEYARPLLERIIRVYPDSPQAAEATAALLALDGAAPQPPGARG